MFCILALVMTHNYSMQLFTPIYFYCPNSSGPNHELRKIVYQTVQTGQSQQIRASKPFHL